MSDKGIIETESSVPQGWRKVKLGEVFNVNPSYKMVKGKLAKKVAMDCIAPYTRKISSYKMSRYTGGTKFKNGDTLMARITPCLENGKTAYVNVLDNSEIAFGSTEYIVFSSKEGVSDSKFIYYTSITPYFRDIAIKSMSGTTGRQRVQTEVLIDTEIYLPPLAEQEDIADVLSSLDDKIENNNKINDTLEQIAQAIFKEWFVEFEFPVTEEYAATINRPDLVGKPYKSSGGEMIDSELGLIPLGWRVGTVGEQIGYYIGGDWGSDEITDKNSFRVKCIRGADFPKAYTGNTSDIPMRFISEESFSKRRLQSGDIVLEISGGTKGRPVGRTIYISAATSKENIVFSNFCRLIRCNNLVDSAHLFYQLQYYYYSGVIEEYQVQSTGISNFQFADFLSRCELIIPRNDIQKMYYELISNINGSNYTQQNQTLSALRDTLLPKLMSGELRV